MGRRFLIYLAVLFVAVAQLAGCGMHQHYTSTQVHALSISREQLAGNSLAFLTPSSITGHEEDRQSLAMAFQEGFEELRPQQKLVPLPETLSNINRDGLASDYKRMMEDYSITGMFDKEVLQKIGAATGARYLVQLKLQSFQQSADGRWGMLGWRILETKMTTIRVFMQVWDAQEGAVVWEGAQEVTTARESVSAEAISFRKASEAVANSLIKRLP